MSARAAGLLLALAPCLAACASRVPLPDVPATGAGEAHAAWARVLERQVDERGRIDFEALRADPGDLGTWLLWVAEHGPRATPEGFDDAAAVLAYYLNAYNGLAMWNVLLAGVLPEQMVRFFGLRDLRVDGEWISLYELENELIRPLGEPRVHFVLNCMVRDCPRLAREPLEPARLEAQLDAAAREFLGDPRRARLEQGVVRLSPILTWYEEDYLLLAPSLVAFVNRYRDERLPEDTRVEALDYDWTLNAAPPRP